MNEMIIGMIDLLNNIIESPQSRQESIRTFQELIGNSKTPIIQNETLWEHLCDLAYDLNYFEPDEAERKREPTLFGEDRLKDEIIQVRAKLQAEL